MNIKLDIATSSTSSSKQLTIDLLSGWHKLKDDKPRSSDATYFQSYRSSSRTGVLHHIINTCLRLGKRQGIYSTIEMESAGFDYTDHGDTVICHTCGIQVSAWTSEMKPFTIHSQRSPTCEFVRSMLPTHKILSPSPITLPNADQQQPVKRQRTQTTHEASHLNHLVEVNMLKQVRKRTFSNWPHHTSPSSTQMIQAGFFSCNVSDRVICLYCNIICQQWTPHTDDPSKMHKVLSPKCSYVTAIMTPSQSSPIVIVNEYTGRDHLQAANRTDPLRWNDIVYAAACHRNYIEIPRREASFSTWSSENLPSVDALVRAGFFFAGNKTIVTCFYCNGSLQNWGPNDNPMIEHARWFPNCAYAKQLCGADLYRNIQESKRAQQERCQNNGSIEEFPRNAGGSNRDGLNIPDESTLSRFVAARIDLSVSQTLLDRKFKLSIIKRCWEDQLRLKHDDFDDDCDLLMACTILQKQIDHIGGNKEKITVPSIAMQKLREKEQAAETVAREHSASATSVTNASLGDDTEMSASSESAVTDTNASTSAATASERSKISSSEVATSKLDEAEDPSPVNPCVLCLAEEKRLACIPCGHLVTCVHCGQSLRLCPICHRGIEAFVRIYL